jgi:hypothetical protein
MLKREELYKVSLGKPEEATKNRTYMRKDNS